MTNVKSRRSAGAKYSASMSEGLRYFGRPAGGQSSEILRSLNLDAPGNAGAVTRIRERRRRHQVLDREQSTGLRLKKMCEGKLHRREYSTGIGGSVGTFQTATQAAPANRSPADKLVARRRQLECLFAELASAWQTETAFLSSLTQMCTHPAYQRIVGMGESALPFIFRELPAEPDHWFWALKAITGCDPVTPSHQGDLDAMASDWLAWGRSKGYVTP